MRTHCVGLGQPSGRFKLPLKTARRRHRRASKQPGPPKEAARITAAARRAGTWPPPAGPCPLTVLTSSTVLTLCACRCPARLQNGFRTNVVDLTGQTAVLATIQETVTSIQTNCEGCPFNYYRNK